MVLALNVGASAHEPGQLDTPADFVDFRLPGFGGRLFRSIRGFRRWALVVHKIVE